MEHTEKEKRIAVLIDAENVSDRYIKIILDELTKYGTPTYKRIYGDWTIPQMSSWKQVLLSHSLTPIQQYHYTQGKSSTDSALIIDAMDILYSDSVDSFCIVSSDSDFTRLAVRLREAGMFVIGMGERKTPQPFISSCEVFRYLDVLAHPVPASIPAPRSVPESRTVDQGMATIDDIRRAVKAIIEEFSDEDGWAFMGTIGGVLSKRYPDFDARNYGHIKLTSLVKSLGCFEIEPRQTSNPSIKHMYVRTRA